LTSVDISAIFTPIDTKGEVITMMDPRTATLIAGRFAPHHDRDAEQLAAARDAEARTTSGYRATLERVQAFFGRTQAPSSASCDCTD